MRLVIASVLALGVIQLPKSVAEELSAYQDNLNIIEELISSSCLDCHTGADAEREFRLDDVIEDWKDSVRSGQTGLERDAAIRLEQALRRFSSHQMPPPEFGRIDEAEFVTAKLAWESLLADRAKQNPFAGQSAQIRRMTRTEYRNAIRDLFDLKVDVTQVLPPDSSSGGFDNITVDDLSPLLLERYLTAATKISRLVVGASIDQPLGLTVRVPADLTQQNHVPGLPLGTRGGVVFDHHFPRTGSYEVSVRLMRDRDENIEGIYEPHQMDVLLDREQIKRFELKPPKGRQGHSEYDKHLRFRIDVQRGSHQIGVTFVENGTSLQEIKRQPFDASYNRHRHPRRTPAVAEVNVIGPFQIQASGSDIVRCGQLSWERVPNDPVDEARQVLTRCLRIAYRRPIDEVDLRIPMKHFDVAYQEGARFAFEQGLEAALTSVLSNPHFLLKTIAQPETVHGGTVYPITSNELASRLSFFLCSSLPDETLLRTAEQDRLVSDAELERQTRRLLASDRAESLVENFADQWLYLRNLPTITPDLRRFPNFDHNLREAFASETKLLFADVIERDASVLELLDPPHAFLNERLASHYGIPGIVGDHFRRVTLSPQWHRGGLLRQGSVLMATSYATRTSPTIRGAWVLENILGTPPPPPPPNVPTIQEKSGHVELSFRQMLAKHRNDAACASCHDLIDPVGFALDRFDAVGRWSQMREGQTIDAEGRLPDGTIVDGVEALEQGIIKQPELFVTALTEKLMTYALGRPLTELDGPEIRKIVQRAAENGYRFSDLVCGITKSVPFRYRTAD